MKEEEVDERRMASPMPLQEWANANKPAEGLIYRKGYWSQITFIRDDVPEIFARSDEEYKKLQEGIQVISWHTSKSVRLPVFRIELPDGTVLVMRYNFHNWIVSASSPRDIDDMLMGFLSPEDEAIHRVYCEGFPQDLVYESYGQNKRQFTIELDSGYYCLYTFLFLFDQLIVHKDKSE